MGKREGALTVGSIVCLGYRGQRVVYPPESPLYKDALPTAIARIDEDGKEWPILIPAKSAAKKFAPTGAVISLHGLGFIQIKLDASQRMHVWHPDLPRRSCFEHSQIHDHRFGFTSLVLKGMQINDIFSVYEQESPIATGWSHRAYVHEGERSANGNRPWIPREELWVGEVSRELVEAGKPYYMLPKVFHSTTPGGDGRVATLMTKTTEGVEGARSLCERGVEPDVDFDRFQLPDDELWRFVRDVIR